MIDPRTRARPAPGVLVKELDGEAVLLDLSSETYFGLNATAYGMWRALTTQPSIGAALDALGREYDVAASVLRRDAFELLEQLFADGLVTIADA